LVEAHNKAEEANNRERLASYQPTYQVLQTGNTLLAQNLLKPMLPKGDEQDIRGFEWYYLDRLAQGAGVQRLSDHTDPVTAICFEPKGGLRSIGRDGKIRFWDP